MKAHRKEKTMTPEAIIQAANYHMTKAWERQAQGQDLTQETASYALSAYRLACAGRLGAADRMATRALTGTW